MASGAISARAAPSPGHERVEKRDIGHAAPHRPDGIARRRERHYAACRIAVSRRAKSRDAAQGGGNTRRAAGVGAKPAWHDASRDGGGGPAGRAAGDHLLVVRIAHRPEGGVVRGDAEGKLVQVRLASEQRPFGQQSRQGRRVVGGWTCERARAPGCRKIGCVDVVLDRQGQPVQPLAVSSRRRASLASAAVRRASASMARKQFRSLCPGGAVQDGLHMVAGGQRAAFECGKSLGQ